MGASYSVAPSNGGWLLGSRASAILRKLRIRTLPFAFSKNRLWRLGDEFRLRSFAVFLLVKLIGFLRNQAGTSSV
jgi:hypothetical protein